MYIYNHSNRNIDSFSAKNITEINDNELLQYSNILTNYNQELFLFKNKGTIELYEEFCNILIEKEWYITKLNHFENIKTANERYHKYKVKNIRLKKEITRLLKTEV